MPWKPEKKQESRQKILDAAAELFALQGYDAVSIDQVMIQAELTRGAFYSHFKSKSDLYYHAIVSAARVASESIIRHGNRGDKKLDVAEFARQYLAIGSEGALLSACPLAFLVTDICHREPEIKRAYTKVLGGYQQILVTLGLQQATAEQVSILLIGGLALSRTVADEAMRSRILESSLSGALALAENTSTALQ